MTPTQVNSAKIYLAKFIPDLSSIEQEIHLPEWQLLDPAQIAIQAAQLLASNPAYLVDIMMADPAARSAVQQALDTVIATDQARVTPAVLDS